MPKKQAVTVTPDTVFVVILPTALPIVEVFEDEIEAKQFCLSTKIATGRVPFMMARETHRKPKR